MDAHVADGGLSAEFRAALTGCAASGLSGMLLVAGDPGGVVHLADGAIAAVQTPGAPSAEVILLRSHRVSEAAWDAAFTSAASNGRPMGAELVAADAIGAGELEALLRIALADAIFVLASGLVEECRAQPGPVDCLLPLEPGAEADVLLDEAARRIQVLSGRSGGNRPDRDRVVPVPGAMRPRLPLSRGQDEIMSIADGRRNARDMAFALGRGAYITTLEVARMREAGLLATVPLAASGSAGQAAVPDGSPAEDERDTSAELPQRRKGLPSLPRRPQDMRAAEGKPAPYRLLRPRSGRHDDTG